MILLGYILVGAGFLFLGLCAALPPIALKVFLDTRPRKEVPLSDRKGNTQ